MASEEQPITPAPGPVRGAIRPPGSKSITNRACVCAMLAPGRSRLLGALESEDTHVMAEALRRLGYSVSGDAVALTIERRGGAAGPAPGERVELSVGNSGTTIRFLTAALAAVGGEYRLDGIPRMRERPIRDLLDALVQLGADARSELGTGCPPVIVRGDGLRGGTVAIKGDVSSQFLSGLLMAAPLARAPVEIRVEGPLVSRPYVDMTLAVMRSFGVDAEALLSASPPTIRVAPQSYRACDYEIEPDASAASYFWGAAAITGGEVLVEGLSRGALQGDVEFCSRLEAMGCEVLESSRGLAVRGGRLRGIETDMNSISDTVQTLAAVALFAEGPTTIRGVAHIRHKETDRIGDLARELRKFGAEVEEYEDGLRISPPTALRPATIATYNDHRMAMSLSLVGLRQPGVVILDPSCTAKTYPRFFADLERLVRG